MNDLASFGPNFCPAPTVSAQAFGALHSCVAWPSVLDATACLLPALHGRQALRKIFPNARASEGLLLDNLRSADSLPSAEQPLTT